MAGNDCHHHNAVYYYLDLDGSEMHFYNFCIWYPGTGYSVNILGIITE